MAGKRVLRRPSLLAVPVRWASEIQGIRVRDMDRSIDFYRRVMGMDLTWRMNIREIGGRIAVLKSPRGQPAS